MKLNRIEKADETTHYVLFISDLVGAASGHGGYCEQGMFCIKLTFFKTYKSNSNVSFYF